MHGPDTLPQLPGAQSQKALKQHPFFSIYNEYSLRFENSWIYPKEILFLEYEIHF